MRYVILIGSLFGYCTMCLIGDYTVEHWLTTKDILSLAMLIPCVVIGIYSILMAATMLNQICFTYRPGDRVYCENYPYENTGTYTTIKEVGENRIILLDLDFDDEIGYSWVTEREIRLATDEEWGLHKAWEAIQP